MSAERQRIIDEGLAKLIEAVTTRVGDDVLGVEVALVLWSLRDEAVEAARAPLLEMLDRLEAA